MGDWGEKEASKCINKQVIGKWVTGVQSPWRTLGDTIYAMNWIVSPQNCYVEPLILNVMVFEDKAYKEVIKN